MIAFSKNKTCVIKSVGKTHSAARIHVDAGRVLHKEARIRKRIQEKQAVLSGKLCKKLGNLFFRGVSVQVKMPPLSCEKYKFTALSATSLARLYTKLPHAFKEARGSDASF
jgi:hypothetical protein